MSKSIKVIQIIDGMRIGGAEILLRDLARGLLDRGYKVGVLYSTSGPVSDEIEALHISISRIPRLGILDPLLMIQMWWKIRREKPDIVHTHLIKSDFYGRLAARLAGVGAVVSTLHNFDRWATKPILARIYGWNARLASVIVAVSDEVSDYAVRSGLCKPEKIITIPNAIPIDRFKRDKKLGIEIRQEFNIPVSAPLVGIVARISKQKDHSNFLHASVRVSHVRPDTRFLVVGDGPDRQAMIALADSLEQTSSVIFSGVRRDMRAIYSALDLLVFSSRWEGLPVAMLEGMAAGLPIVSTKVGGISEVLEDGRMGFLVPPRDSIALADACLRLIEDPARRNSMGEAARVEIAARYDLSAMVDSIDRLYKSLMV